MFSCGHTVKELVCVCVCVCVCACDAVPVGERLFVLNLKVYCVICTAKGRKEKVKEGESKIV